MPLRVACDALLLSCLALVVIGDHGPAHQRSPSYRPNICLAGDKHKAAPSPEDDSYQTCHLWKDSSCCTAEFTQQLAGATVTNIDGFHWNRCGDLSPSCQRFFVEIECFYRCSPNIGHWHGEHDSSVTELPICSHYCDRWFEACADDMSCATNWITDWHHYNNGSNTCMASETCSTYRQRYGNGTYLCENLWGQSFLASTNANACLLPWYNVTDGNTINPNLAAIRSIFNTTDGSAALSAATAQWATMTASLLVVVTATLAT